ncbi:hypothetical protein HAHE_09210 [Haloferula helveola]|uniref:DUF1501 domain-containing protein n=1 Tax=Haloferula helveola TaxID=490095 RepID=A0ABN6H0M9_9BACT|nr:hypothetical protein HAHE_09210 [Haloferula helveola]
MSTFEPNRHDELTRRTFISNAARWYLGVNLAPMLGSSIASAAPAPTGAKAKNVIYLYMSGGMSHLDTFDPKPKKKEVMGPVETLDTSATDVFVGSYLPKTAKVMDKVCVVNSMNSKQGAHEQGTYMMHTSYAMRGTVKHPSLGAWVLKLGGRINPDIPGYVAISASPDVTGGGFFGAKYAAAPIGSADEGLKDSRKPGNVSGKDFDRRLALADRLNKQFHGRYENADVKAYEELYQEAIRLMNSEDLKAFNLNDEPQSARNLYGGGRFAQGCMLARRLVEHGVRFVEVQLGGWDTHYDNFAGVEGRCNEFDQAYSALITDLEKRGMLKDTLVVVATEFGRTPEIKTEHNDGRDHHPSAFSCLLAGGGVKGGFKYGETDSTGSRVKDNPVTPQDFNATIAHAMGIPHDQVIMSPSQRPFRISDKGSPIMDVFA